MVGLKLLFKRDILKPSSSLSFILLSPIEDEILI